MKITFQTAIVLSLAVLLAACQTTYGEMGPTGGVTAAPVTNDVYRISARGNGFTDAATIQDYVLLKAAETTLQAGETHFAVLSNSDATRRSVGQMPGTIQTTVWGNTAYSTVSPGATYDIVKPGEDLIIRVFTPGRGQPMQGAFPAQEIFDNINPRVERSGA